MNEAIERPPSTLQETAIRWSTNALMVTVWVSALIFGFYILAFYVAAIPEQDLARWNEILPDLFEEGEPVATASIGLHFAAGAIILILGAIQLIDAVRVRFPKLHRWGGVIYIVASIITAVGGLTFILISGTVGGTVMNIGFTLYGVLMLVSAIETYRHARAGRWETHNLWAWRLYALAIASWLYRMEYGFWFIFMGEVGHTADFTGPFDYFMDFFFYIPNLLVVELIFRTRHKNSSPIMRGLTLTVLISTTGFLLVGTYFFASFIWTPAIFSLFTI